MTLIVARDVGNEIRMYADAKISNPHELRNNPLKGALKLIVVNDVCIGYAGNYHVAIDAIRDVKTLQLKAFGQITEHLFKVHQETGGEVDFIIAVQTPIIKLIKITNNQVEVDLKAAWIGDHDAFTEYQKLYHSVSQNNQQEDKRYIEITKMGDAISQIVREHKHGSVGDFVISIRSSAEGFKYLGNAMVLPAPQTIPSGEWTTMQFGTAQQGGYAYTVMWPLKTNIGAIGVHFHQGNVGALYHPIQKDEAIVYSGVSFEEFKAAVNNDYGFQIDGIRLS